MPANKLEMVQQGLFEKTNSGEAGEEIDQAPELTIIFIFINVRPDEKQPSRALPVGLMFGH